MSLTTRLDMMEGEGRVEEYVGCEGRGDVGGRGRCLKLKGSGGIMDGEEG